MANYGKEIAKAFVKAQKAFAPAIKNKSNSHFQNMYADLGACIDAVIEALHQNDIALIQMPKEASGGISMTTCFLHDSGESFEAGTVFVPANKNNAQGYGSALTYARRYSLCAACGIASEDDDGNGAVATLGRVNMREEQFQKVESMEKLKVIWGNLSPAEQMQCVSYKEAAKARLLAAVPQQGAVSHG